MLLTPERSDDHYIVVVPVVLIVLPFLPAHIMH